MAKFIYGVTKVKDIRANSKDENGVHRIESLTIDGHENVLASPRFWASLGNRFYLNKNVFRYFSPEEVFSRVSERAKKKDEVRYCVEEGDSGQKRVLAVTNPDASIVKYLDLLALVQKYGTDDVQYHDGIVTSRHAPRAGLDVFNVGPDLFQNRFIIDTPIDGFGRPSVYLAMMRLVCSNGAIGYAPAFRSEISSGSKAGDLAYNIVRALDGFNNEDGYSVMRSRFEMAQRSWASVREANKVYKAMSRLVLTNHIKGITGAEFVPYGENGDLMAIDTALPLFRRFHDMTGDVYKRYGIANIDVLTQKKQRALPVECTMFDLLNFVTELATHHADTVGARELQSIVGGFIGDAGLYDLEGTRDKIPEFQDFFVLPGDLPVSKSLIDESRIRTGDVKAA